MLRQRICTSRLCYTTSRLLWSRSRRCFTCTCSASRLPAFCGRYRLAMRAPKPYVKQKDASCQHMAFTAPFSTGHQPCYYCQCIAPDAGHSSRLWLAYATNYLDHMQKRQSTFATSSLHHLLLPQHDAKAQRLHSHELKNMLGWQDEQQFYVIAGVEIL